jgi:hypothetical protein
MNAAELKVAFPKLYQQVFDAGVRAERRRIEAAALIAGIPETRDLAPVSFARVPVNAAGRGGRHSWSQRIKEVFPQQPTIPYEQHRQSSA